MENLEFDATFVPHGSNLKASLKFMAEAYGLGQAQVAGKIRLDGSVMKLAAPGRNERIELSGSAVGLARHVFHRSYRHATGTILEIRPQSGSVVRLLGAGVELPENAFRLPEMSGYVYDAFLEREAFGALLQAVQGFRGAAALPASVGSGSAISWDQAASYEATPPAPHTRWAIKLAAMGIAWVVLLGLSFGMASSFPALSGALNMVGKVLMVVGFIGIGLVALKGPPASARFVLRIDPGQLSVVSGERPVWFCTPTGLSVRLVNAESQLRGKGRNDRWGNQPTLSVFIGPLFEISTKASKPLCIRISDNTKMWPGLPMEVVAEDYAISATAGQHFRGWLQHHLGLGQVPDLVPVPDSLASSEKQQAEEFMKLP